MSKQPSKIVKEKNKQIIPKPTVTNPQTRTVHLYKYEDKFMSSFNERVFIVEIFLPEDKLCVNFSSKSKKRDSILKIFESEWRTNDCSEYRSRLGTEWVTSPKYYDHKEIQIPQDLYEKIKLVAKMKKRN